MLSTTHSPPTLTGVSHQWTVSINIGYIQWLSWSLAKPTLKVTPTCKNRSLAVRTSKCGWAIRLLGFGVSPILNHAKPPLVSTYHASLMFLTGRYQQLTLVKGSSCGIIGIKIIMLIKYLYFWWVCQGEWNFHIQVIM